MDSEPIIDAYINELPKLLVAELQGAGQVQPHYNGLTYHGRYISVNQEVPWRTHPGLQKLFVVNIFLKHKMMMARYNVSTPVENIAKDIKTLIAEEEEYEKSRKVTT